MKTTINDPRLLDLTHEQAEISLAFFKEEESQQFIRLEEILGLRWTREAVESMIGSEDTIEDVKATDLNIIRYPLSLIMKPNLVQELKLRFGGSNIEPTEGDDNFNYDPGMPYTPPGSVSMSTLSKEEFFQRLGRKASDPDDMYIRGSRKEPGFKPGPGIKLGR
jgi:hypothetical protein